MKKIIGVIMICLCILIYLSFPFSYIQPDYHIQIESEGYSLSEGYMGLKVYEVKKALNLSLKNAKYDNETIDAVKKFQEQSQLPVTGIVNLETWKTLGYEEKDWYDLEIYVTPCLVDENASRDERIETMIHTAYNYLGTQYVVGASGKPQTGVDCSGLIMQVMYSVGLNPSPISPIRHAKPGYEYESYSLWNHSHIQHYDWAKREKGDLVFFCNQHGKVNHVGLYIGDNQVIEAVSQGVVKNTIHTDREQYIKCVGRLM